MESEFEKKLQNVKPKPLSNDEREYMWTQIKGGISYVPAWKRVFGFLRLPNGKSMKKIIVTPLLIIGLLLGSVTTTFAYADGSKPGDFLFPADIAAEKIMLTLAFGDAEDELRVEFAQERLDEVKELLALAESFTFTTGSTTVTGTNMTATTSATSTDDAGTDSTATSTDSGADDTATSTDDTATSTNDTNDSSDTSTTTGDTTDADADTTTNTGTTNANPDESDLINSALLYALQQLEDSKDLFQSEGNETGLLAIDAFIAELSGIAQSHVNKMDNVVIQVKNDDDDTKVKISASSKELKTKFKFSGETGGDGDVEQKFTINTKGSSTRLSVKSDDDDSEVKFTFKQKDENRKNDDDDDDHDDDDNKGKITICHNHNQTITVSKSSWKAHKKHGDEKGSCDSESDVERIELRADQSDNKVRWDTDGKARHGFKVVWSKEARPTYPTRSTDKSIYLSSNNADSQKVHAFDGTGTYYVRVCEYLGSTCGVYSNQVTLDLVSTDVILAGPSCGYEDGAGRTVVHFDDGRLRSDKDNDDARSDIEPVSLAAGTYRITHVSYDGYKGRKNTTQLNEQWHTVLLDGNVEITQTGTVSDIQDGVEEALVDEVVNNALIIDSDVTRVQAVHSYYPNASTGGHGANSVEAVCTVFERIDTSDNDAPIISNVVASSTVQTAAEVTWNTDETATSKIYVSASSPVNTGAATIVMDVTPKTSHSLTLTILSASTTYFYIVESADAAGNIATSSEESFTTRPVPVIVEVDDVAPIISDVLATPTTTEATITWTTDEAATSTIWFSETAPVDTAIGGNSQDGFVTSHTRTLTALTASTTYYYIISVSDEAGNVATTAEAFFTTEAEPEPVDTAAPVITSVTATSTGSTTAQVSWTTDEPASSKIFYSSTDPVDTETADFVSSPTLTGDHSFDLTGLSTSTTYYFIIESKDSLGNTATGTQDSFDIE